MCTAAISYCCQQGMNRDDQPATGTQPRQRPGWVAEVSRVLERGRARSGRPWQHAIAPVSISHLNPGNLRMFGYRPPTLADNPALVVVLHGCTQSAAEDHFGAGWSTLADRYGFALLLPEQQPSNNPNGCFNWFQPEHSRRDQGEPFSISADDRKICRRSGYRSASGFHHRAVGRRRYYIEHACLLSRSICRWGDRCGTSRWCWSPRCSKHSKSMYQSPSRSAREWADLVRKASSHRGPWPRVSVWHGNDDKTVIPSNALENPQAVDRDTWSPAGSPR